MLELIVAFFGFGLASGLSKWALTRAIENAIREPRDPDLVPAQIRQDVAAIVTALHNVTSLLGAILGVLIVLAVQ